MDEEIQATNSRYQVITKLGQGGMALVLLVLARSRAGVNKLLVVKELLPELREDPEFLAMFLDEARLSVRLNHPNVIQTYEVDDSRSHPSIVMEYLEGQPLSALLNRVGRDKMPLGLHLYLLEQVAAGLHHAHELQDFDGTPLGVVHRDISPHNVFITYEGQVKVVDFGIAKAANSSLKTGFGVFKGKVNYAAPEQILGEPVDCRCDVFALGILLWEALARRRLSFREPEGEVMQRRIQGLDPAVQSVAVDAPEELSRICNKAMARAVEDRFKSAEDFRLALETHLESTKRMGARELRELIREAFSVERSEIRRQVDTRVKELDQTSAPAGGPAASPAEIQEVSSKGTAARLSLSSEAELAPPPQPSSTRRKPLVIGLVAAGLLVSLLAFRSQQARSAVAGPTPPPSSAAASASSAVLPVTISLAVTPAHARLSLDGVPLSANPFRATMPRDSQSHRLSVSAQGFMTEERLVVFDRDLTLELTLTPSLPPPEPLASAPPAPTSVRRPGGGARPPQTTREEKPSPALAPTPGEALTGAAQKKPRPIDETF